MDLEKKMLIGIDEFTLTILLKNKCNAINWINYAENIIGDFVQKSELETVLNGTLQEVNTGKLQGYTTVYNLGSKDFYIALGYNETHPRMGVCIRFSAKAWLIYQVNFRKLYRENILLPDFLVMVNNNETCIRLSRIDMTVDYFDYGIDIDLLYKNLKANKLSFQDEHGRNLIKNISFLGKNGKIETLYLGSKKENSKGFMRVYNKKMEQIQNNGYRKQEAIACSDWIRFEAVFKGKYAHLITNTLLHTEMNEVDFKCYIAQIVAQKYRFFDYECDSYTEYTADLVKVAERKEYPKLYCESARDNALNKNIEHLRKGSGLFPTMYKVQALYGEDGLKSFCQYLHWYYTGNFWIGKDTLKELNLWLKKHEDLRNVPLENNY